MLRARSRSSRLLATRSCTAQRAVAGRTTTSLSVIQSCRRNPRRSQPPLAARTSSTTTSPRSSPCDHRLLFVHHPWPSRTIVSICLLARNSPNIAAARAMVLTGSRNFTIAPANTALVVQAMIHIRRHWRILQPRFSALLDHTCLPARFQVARIPIVHLSVLSRLTS